MLAAQGARVVLGARRLEKLEDCVTEIKQNGGEAVAVALDVREKDSIAGFLDAAYEHYGRCDVVINNAGVEAGAKTYHTIDEDDWDFVLDTNPKVCMVGFKLYTDRVVAHNQGSGNIIMVSSITDSRTIKGQFHTPYQKAV